LATAPIPLRRKIGALIAFLDLPAVQVWVAAAALGLGYGLQKADATVSQWLTALVGMSLLFTYLMGVNDVFDVQIDSQKHESSGLAVGAISGAEANASVLLSGGLGLLACYFVSAWFFAFAIIIFLLSTLYSAPPVRYKRFYPFSTLGEFAGGYFLFPLGLSVVSGPTSEGLLISFVPMMVAASMRLGHEAKYVEFDRATGKRTLAVVHGAKNVQRVVVLLPYAAAVLTLVLFLLQIVQIQLALLMLIFIPLPSVIRKTIRAWSRLRPVSFFWGFLFYLLALSVS
jgi:4-hydroxybenzoate polyprenyltransferase